MSSAAARTGALVRQGLLDFLPNRHTSESRERVVLLWTAVGSRTLIWATALSALAVFGTRGVAVPPPLTVPFSSQAANFVIAPALRYDSAWYLSIAHSGYTTLAHTAFLPLYPLLIKAAGVLVGSDQIAGLLISLVGMLVAFKLLYSLTKAEIGESAAKTALLLLAFFPAALFLSAVYTEALFLALTLGCFAAAKREHWMQAAILAGLASATRSSGVLLCVPLAVLYLNGPRSGSAMRRRTNQLSRRLKLRRPAAWLVLAPAGLFAYMGYLAVAHGTPLALFEAERAWSRQFAGPFGAAVHALLVLPASIHDIASGTQTRLGASNPLGWQTYQLIDLPFLAFGLTGLWLSWRKLPLAYTLYALLALAEALSAPVAEDPMKSISRYLIVIFPLFMAWGAFLTDRTIARRVMLTISAGGLIAFSALWGIWAWVA